MRAPSFLSVRAVLFIAFVALNAISAAPIPQSNRSASDRDFNAIGKRTITKTPNLASLDHEKAMGAQYAAAFESVARRIDDPAVVNYVGRLAGMLAQNSDTQIPITIRVINLEIPNAFVLPGGFLYVTSGLILQMESEGELAGVLAHGIAHTALRHGTQTLSRAELANIAGTLGNFPVGPNVLITEYGLILLGGQPYSIPTAFLKLQRDDEFDADFFGLQYLYKAGYDPDCFIRFINRMGDPPSSGKKVPRELSPIPPAADRVKAMNKEIAEILPPRATDIISTADFEAFKDRVRILQSVEQQLKSLTPNRDAEFETPPFLKRLPPDSH
ncbi:MAG TPA: M48 family metalloprotease [Candidatus Acidoferrum sp.]|nr:M48 family metalloprotease [Candidatus Acidoferrum sp.]